MKPTTLFLPGLALLLTLDLYAQKPQDSTQTPIFPKGERAPASNMTGTVWLNALSSGDSTFDYHIGYVTFEPRARTFWHYHPGGQILLVTEGTGFYQEKGKPIRTITKGDVIRCQPNVEHWHGATPQTQLVHIGITNDTPQGRVVWLDPVTDDEYGKTR